MNDSSSGSGVRPVPGTSEGYGPVFAPDGRTIAFARTSKRARPKSRDEDTATLRNRSATTLQSVSAWLVDVDGGGLGATESADVEYLIARQLGLRQRGHRDEGGAGDACCNTQSANTRVFPRALVLH